MSGPVKGVRSYFALSTAAASTSPKSIQGADARLSREGQEIDVTVWSTAENEVTLMSFKRATITFSGPWSSTKDARLANIFGSTGVTFHYGPEGSTTGKVKYSGTGFLRQYEISNPVGGAVTFSAEFKPTSSISRSVF